MPPPVCCIGPLAAVGLGIGSFGAAALFEDLRPYLLGLTALLLAGAFYLNYRKQSGAECADGTCAVIPEKRKRTMLLWLATGAVAALASVPYYSGMLSDDSASADVSVLAASNSDGEALVVFAVDGMNCAGCGFTLNSCSFRTLSAASSISRGTSRYFSCNSFNWRFLSIFRGRSGSVM